MKAFTAAGSFAGHIEAVGDDHAKDQKANEIVHVVSLVKDWNWKRNVASKSW